jgi:hypothetical protein
VQLHKYGRRRPKSLTTLPTLSDNPLRAKELTLSGESGFVAIMYIDRLSSYLLQSTSWLHGQVPIGEERTASRMKFSWDEVRPQKHLQWQPCFGDLQCARLRVPMDWTGGSAEANKTVDLAVIKVEATVPITDPTYGGTVVLNPGIFFEMNVNPPCADDS